MTELRPRARARITIRVTGALAVVLALAGVVAACGPATPGSSSAPGTPPPATVEPPITATPAATAPATPQPTAPPAASPTMRPVGAADIEAARARWATQHTGEYAWRVSFGCECLLAGPVEVLVKDGAAVRAVRDGAAIDLATVGGFPLTVEALFDEAAAALAGGGTVQATFAQNGVPLQLYLDRDPQAVDDELSVTVLSVEGPA